MPAESLSEPRRPRQHDHSYYNELRPLWPSAPFWHRPDLVVLDGDEKAMRRTFQDLARRAAVDGLVQRSICGHLTEEMTERYSSVAQVEVEAALGKVVSLAGYRDLLGGASSGARSGASSGSGGKVVGNEVGGIEVSGAGELQPTAVA